MGYFDETHLKRHKTKFQLKPFFLLPCFTIDHHLELSQCLVHLLRRVF